MDRSPTVALRWPLARRRGSREPCGSKSFHICVFSICNLSRLARALWIEVPYYDNLPRVERSRLARALWIEVSVLFQRCSPSGRGSREPCGSKGPAVPTAVFLPQSRLARALWIEGFKSSFVFLREASRLARALWIEGFLYLYT